MCGWRTKSTLSGISHLQCEWRKCALPEGSNLQSDSVRRECVTSEGLHLS